MKQKSMQFAGSVVPGSLVQLSLKRACVQQESPGVQTPRFFLHAHASCIAMLLSCLLAFAV